MGGRSSITLVALTLALVGAGFRADAAPSPEADQTQITVQTTAAVGQMKFSMSSPINAR